MNATHTLRGLIEVAVERHQTSVRQLALRAHDNGFKVVDTTLNQIRNGTYKFVPSEVTLRAIAWLAGVDASVAFMAAGQPVPGPPFAEELPPGVDNLPPKARKAAIDMLRVLVDMNQDADNARSNDDQEQPADSAGDNTGSGDSGPGQKMKRGIAMFAPPSAVPNEYALAADSERNRGKEINKRYESLGEESQEPPE